MRLINLYTAAIRFADRSYALELGHLYLKLYKENFKSGILIMDQSSEF